MGTFWSKLSHISSTHADFFGALQGCLCIAGVCAWKISGTLGKCLRRIWGAKGSNWGAFGGAYEELLGSVWEASGAVQGYF